MINLERRLGREVIEEQKFLIQAIAKLGIQFKALSDDKYDLTFVEKTTKGKIMIFPFSFRGTTCWETSYRNLEGYDVPISEFEIKIHPGFKEINIEYDYPLLFLFDSQEEYIKNKMNLIGNDPIRMRMKFVGNKDNRLVMI